MAVRSRSARRRRIADIVIIVAALHALVQAVWAPPAIGGFEGEQAAAHHGFWWWTNAIGAPLALVSVFVALKSTMLARILAGAGAPVLLAGVGAFRQIDWLAVRAIVLPALAIGLATPFMGSMPTPEEEGKPRKGLGDT